ncbi:DUF3581 family protein [Seongchinamella unica]|uniref:DUF3581 family protein n=1 Tax=Seongchinamella unica TaxID=2547392 RepID=A0A4R5LRC3_9GAMM|nr:DUF3581 domain-containing protein [Seongchinamella unica]TDG13370.1 DUF3581 family protein [Seongchinamella unica]
MFLDSFHSKENGFIQITADQASEFAKGISDDFNPIHDPDSRRFCVPGDLLFALVLSSYGISQSMSFSFKGMVGALTPLVFPDTDASRLEIVNDKGKEFLTVERSGEVSRDLALIEAMIRNYVVFSGHNFPGILVPLMAEHNVMINPARPLVIYEGMSFNLEHLGFGNPELELSKATLLVSGKRGDAELHFNITDAGRPVGTGLKKLVLSGLREYEEPAMQGMCDLYQARKQSYMN